MPTPRDFSSEIYSIPNLNNLLLGADYNNALQFGGAYGDLARQNYGTAMFGREDLPGAATLARQGFDLANPQLGQANAHLGASLDVARPVDYVSPLGYGAQTARAPVLGAAPQTRAATASLSRVGPSVLAGGLTADALNYGQVSPIQLEMQRQAMEGLGAGGALTQGEFQGAQDSARSAFADRGLVRSNRGIGAEILNTDAARRNRLNEARTFAGAVDAQGFNQLQGGRNFALSAGQFLQAPEYFNAQAGNALAQFNAGQRNQVGMNNTALAGQYGLTRYGTEADLARFNATAGNDASRFNAAATNEASALNANIARTNASDMWGRNLDYANFLRSQTIDPSGLAQSFAGARPDYTNSLLNYGSDVYNTNFNAQSAAEIARGNNSAAKTGSIVQGIGTVAAAKIMFMCLPEGQAVDTPKGPRRVEEIRAGDTVTGYEGAPVRVLQKHEYAEDPHARRFLDFTLENGATLSTCDMHRIEGVRAHEYRPGQYVDGRRIASIRARAGVERSFDLLTTDAGYRLAGVPVNSMIEELAAAVSAVV